MPESIFYAPYVACERNTQQDDRITAVGPLLAICPVGERRGQLTLRTPEDPTCRPLVPPLADHRDYDVERIACPGRSTGMDRRGRW